MKLYKEIARVLGQKNKSLNVIEKELTLFKEVLPIRLNPVIKDGNRIEAGCVISLFFFLLILVISRILSRVHYQ